MNWLFKEEPTHYSFDALVKDKRTVWSGVKNPLAQKHLHAVKKGDRDLLLSHRRREGGRRRREGARRRVCGSGGQDRQAGGRRRRPGQKTPAPGDARRDQGRRAFNDFPLVRISRLSVMPVSEAEWERIEKLGTS